MKPLRTLLMLLCFFSQQTSLEGQVKYLSTLLRDYPMLYDPMAGGSGGWLLYTRINHGVANWNQTGLAYRKTGYGGISSVLLGYEGIPGFLALTADIAHGRSFGKVSADLHIRFRWFHLTGESGLTTATSDLTLGFGAGDPVGLSIWLHDWPAALLPRAATLRSQPAIRIEALYRPDHQLTSMVALEGSVHHPMRVTIGLAFQPRGGLPFAFLTRLFPFGCSLQTRLRSGALNVVLMLDYSVIPGITPTLVLSRHD